MAKKRRVLNFFFPLFFFYYFQQLVISQTSQVTPNLIQRLYNKSNDKKNLLQKQRGIHTENFSELFDPELKVLRQTIKETRALKELQQTGEFEKLNSNFVSLQEKGYEERLNFQLGQDDIIIPKSLGYDDLIGGDAGTINSRRQDFNRYENEGYRRRRRGGRQPALLLGMAAIPFLRSRLGRSKNNGRNYGGISSEKRDYRGMAYNGRHPRESWYRSNYGYGLNSYGYHQSSSIPLRARVPDQFTNFGVVPPGSRMGPGGAGATNKHLGGTVGGGGTGDVTSKSSNFGWKQVTTPPTTTRGKPYYGWNFESTSPRPGIIITNPSSTTSSAYYYGWGRRAGEFPTTQRSTGGWYTLDLTTSTRQSSYGWNMGGSGTTRRIMMFSSTVRYPIMTVPTIPPHMYGWNTATKSSSSVVTGASPKYGWNIGPTATKSSSGSSSSSVSKSVSKSSSSKSSSSSRGGSKVGGSRNSSSGGSRRG